MYCPLCSFEFDEATSSCHPSCAFHKGCSFVCCPNCGYQMTDVSKSRAAGSLRKLFSRFTRPRTSDGAPGICPLSAMRPGQTGYVRAISTGSATRQERLSVFGLTQGARVTLEQRQPAFVVRVGYTELSVERDIADEIMVEVL